MAPKRATINTNLFAKTEPQPAPPQDVLPSRQQDSKAPRQQSVKLVKATVYLPPEAIAALDAARARLRTMAPTRGRAQITLSAIVGAALDLALHDLEDSGPESPLAGMLLSQHDSKTGD